MTTKIDESSANGIDAFIGFVSMIWFIGWYGDVVDVFDKWWAFPLGMTGAFLVLIVVSGAVSWLASPGRKP
jgi:hypothetical protein